MNNIIRNNRGITLIALVITIILMLILVGVVINTTKSGNLFNHAKNATLATKSALQNEMLLSEWPVDEIDDAIYGKSLPIKYVDYKGTRFLIAGQQDNLIAMIPVTFTTSNKYMLSGKYKIENGNMISVSINEEDALTDANFEDFQTRTKTELDNRCQQLFGTNDGKVTALNATTEEETIFNVLSMIGRNITVDDVEDIEELVTKDKEILESIFNILPQSNLNVENIGDFWINAIVNYSLRVYIDMVTRQAEDYGFTIPELSQSVNEEIFNNVTSLLKKEISTEELTSTNDLIKDISLSAYYVSEGNLYRSGIQYWTTECHNDNNGEGIYNWYSGGIDPIDGYMIFGPLYTTDPYATNEFSTLELPIAPVLIVDKSVVQRVDSNQYRINV